MGLFDDYEQYLIKYHAIYGQKTIVLYQNGAFYEVYGIDNEKEKIGAVKQVSDMLNIQMTRRNKSVLDNDRSNLLMAGFPLNQLDRYVTILTEDNGYVVVVVEQITPPPNPQRGVTNIISPGTNLKYLSHPNGNYLVSIYIEKEGRKVSQIKPINLYTIGLTAIDVSTGQSIVYEVGNLLDDEKKAFDETYRFIQTVQPKEIIINTRGLEMSQEQLVAMFDVGQSLIHCHLNQVPVDYYKISYQNEFLGKIFKNTGMLKPIEYVNLETHPTVVIAYLTLLDFCYQQADTILNQIEVPTVWNHINHMILDNNCISQLNLISTTSTQKISSVFNLIDHTNTAMGKRLLKEKLLLPLIDPQQINNRYDCVDYFLQELKDPINEIKHLKGQDKYYLFQLYESQLKRIVDLERLHRKICLILLQPSEFNQLHTSYLAVIELLKIVAPTVSSTTDTTTVPYQLTPQQLVPPTLLHDLNQYIQQYMAVLNIEEASKYNINNVTGSFFRRGYRQQIDQLQDQIDRDEGYFQQLATTISNIITPSDKSVVSYQHTEDIGYHLELTATRYATFDAKSQKSCPIDKSTLKVIHNRSGKTVKITSSEMKKISDQLIETKEVLLKQVVEVYKEFLNQLYQQHQGLMKQVVIFVSNLDVFVNSAKISVIYNYCRPTVVSGDTSTVQTTQLRHPLIERIQETCQYVPQDLAFNSSQNGILLFGVNCSGKSSLMKAIGIAVIMAQAGLYVPAKQMTYTPYHCVMTRIVGNDNLFKGLSSFSVEMGELRGIIKRANQFSLVLGDEICHGTETISAVSLVASAIITLSNSRCDFMFATHLHQLSQIERITTLSNVKMYHLKVKFDANTGDLIYDRRLEEGPGHPIYGLEVAKAMDLDREFIELANEIRKEIMEINTFVATKKSKYNQQLYINQCGIPDCPNSAEATHHIQFQSHADDHGFIDHIPINHKSNLVPLCRQCHDMIHDQVEGHWRYVIKGYVMTSNGPKLDYTKVQNKRRLKLKHALNT
jgi:DNA mismatch repair protein MutS